MPHDYNPTTTTLLPYAMISTYDGCNLKKQNVKGKTFISESAALAWLTREGFKLFNLYRIEKINGTWRTDWQLVSAQG